MTKLLIAVCLVVAPATTDALPLPETIPDALARGSTGRQRTAPSGPVPTIAEVLAQTDLVVRGTIGIPECYLSDDERNVYCDYPIVNPIVTFQSQIVTPERPEVPVIRATQLGGTVTIGNVTFTQTEFGLPPLEPGSQNLFLLKRVGNKYQIVQFFYGAFRITNGSLAPLTSRSDFAPEYYNVPVTQALSDIAARLQALRR